MQITVGCLSHENAWNVKMQMMGVWDQDYLTEQYKEQYYKVAIP